jgi:HEAT repeat protein
MGAIVDAEPIAPLLEALETSPPLVQREAARALGNLSANIEYGDTILRAGVQPHLIALLRSDDQQCQRMAAMALCNLASNIRNQPKMLAGNILEPVVGEVRVHLSSAVLSPAVGCVDPF